MILKEAEEMARKGTKITRPAWNGDFFLYTDRKYKRDSIQSGTDRLS